MKIDKMKKKRLWQISLAIGLVVEIIVIVAFVASIVKTGEFVIDVFKVPGEEAWALKIKTVNFMDVLQLFVFIVIAVWVYIAYLKQRAIDVSKSVVDEKIKTHSLIENLKEGIIVLDPQDNVLVMNKKASELIGGDETNVLTQSINSFISSELQTLVQGGHSGEKDGILTTSGKKVRMNLVVLPPNQEGESNKLICLYEKEAASQGEKLSEEKWLSLAYQYLQYAEKIMSSAMETISSLNNQGLLSLLATKIVISATNILEKTEQLKKTEETFVSLNDVITGAISKFPIADVKFEVPEIDKALKIKIDRALADISLQMILLNAVQRTVCAAASDKRVIIKVAPMGRNIGIAIIDKGIAPVSDDFIHLFDAQHIICPPNSFFINLYLAKEFLAKCGANLTATPHMDGGVLFTIMFTPD